MPIGDVNWLELLQGHCAKVRNDLALDQLAIPLCGFSRQRQCGRRIEPRACVIGDRRLGRLDQRAGIKSGQQPRQLGLGKLMPSAFVFGTIEGEPRDPDRLTQDWKRFTARRGLPRCTRCAIPMPQR